MSRADMPPAPTLLAGGPAINGVSGAPGGPPLAVRGRGGGGGGRAMRGVSWSPDGTRLAFGDAGGVAGVLTADGRILWRCPPHANLVRWVAWSPDGRRLATASFGGSVRAWDAASGQELLRFDE